MTPVIDDRGVLLCPFCRGDYLHSAEVVVYDRKEDAEITRVVTIGAAIEKKCLASRESGNPSGRRHGIAIRFTCEQCGPDVRLELTLAQRKGFTLMGWRPRR